MKQIQPTQWILITRTHMSFFFFLGIKAGDVCREFIHYVSTKGLLKLYQRGNVSLVQRLRSCSIVEINFTLTHTGYVYW